MKGEMIKSECWELRRIMAFAEHVILRFAFCILHFGTLRTFSTATAFDQSEKPFQPPIGLSPNVTVHEAISAVAIHDRQAGHPERDLEIAFTFTAGTDYPRSSIEFGVDRLIKHFNHFNHFNQFNHSDPVVTCTSTVLDHQWLWMGWMGCCDGDSHSQRS